eukprot:Protomagalhaensia_wolfi_Nauph_80__3756@NODE_379_length_2642_cov_8_875912_g285_i0_p2_GENE_NODE_379_length_2642_cov_8_875912_g285_i0NODE_379_length_2642_cov_8_875912_g285_i0_p2_ORF_typecomplete_len397_score51_74BSP_II/PF05432_11/0_00012Med8/PF10232_9/0_0014RNA_pol_3_Rpc31/PF11705_8/0_014CENPB_dimeris/PF09026_10/0_079Ribosomal_60s/PF00428_19/0_26MCM2_N/PF12619_8/4_8MCM2_N/PF12619_8/1_5Importin_rep_6/PF18829_1/0_78FYDLN_acid/PF09538_10/0_074FYDLN_acid/PF09538_10/5_7e03LAT/PF15234_6/1_9LAT/PF15234_6/
MRMSKPCLAVDDSLLPSSYAQVGRDLKALRETQWTGEYPLQHVAQLGAAPSFASNATTPRRVKPACCKACRDCREAWRHAHTHIDPWEIEVVSTSTSGGPDPPAALQAAWQQTRSRRHSSRRQEEDDDEEEEEEESDEDLETSDEDDTSLVAISEAALFGELAEHHAAPTTGNSSQALRSLVGASAPPVHMLVQQVLAPLMDFCRRVPEAKKNHCVSRAPAVPSSDPYESLTSAVPNSTSTSSRLGRSTRAVSVPRLRHASRTPPPRKRAAERPLARRDAEEDTRGRFDTTKSAVAVSPVKAALPPVSMERRRNEHLLSFQLRSVEKIPTSIRATSSSVATESFSSDDILTDSTLPSRVSEFEIITEAICANHNQYLKHTSRTAWPRRDSRGRQSR